MSLKIPVLVLFVAIGIGYWYYSSLTKVPSAIVSLEQGKLQGFIGTSREGRQYSSYLGIPFSRPPVGDLRFKAPLKPSKWEGLWDASYYRPMCLQLDFFFTHLTMGSEDCLYLNVFVPSENKSSKSSLPVMVYIHGGYFHVGTSQLAEPKYFMDHDVILVSTSYRLGALGFLNTGDGVVSGNMGLKDQNMALQWVQKNIASFGGDPSKVTIFGESAGGASVHYHMISPKSKGLFSRAIRQSGSALNYWTMYRQSKEQSSSFAKKLDCPTDNTQTMVECLRKLDGTALLQPHIETGDMIRPQMTLFVPSIEQKHEEAFITEEPIELLKSGRFNKVPVITGYNGKEGLLHSPLLAANKTKLNEAKNFLMWAPKVLHFPFDMREVGDSAKIRDFYFGSESKMNSMSDHQLLEKFTELWGDRLFMAGVSQSAIIESNTNPNPMYMYLYEHEGGFSMSDLIYQLEDPIHPVLGILMDRTSFLFKKYVFGQKVQHVIPGTSHGDEAAMLFSGMLQRIHFQGTDEQMSKDFVKLWVDFASEKQNLRFRGIDIPASKNGTLNFLRISDSPSIEVEPHKSRRLLWDSLKLPAN